MSEEEPRGRGRPTKFTPEVAELIVKALRRGSLLQDAADYARVRRETVFRWLKEGETQEPGEPLEEFCNAVREAQSHARRIVVGRILKASRTDWRAGAWWLGVTDPANYGPKVRVTLEEEFAGAAERIAGLDLPDATKERILAALVGESAAEEVGRVEVPPDAEDSSPAG
jgi:hypothetical protein